MRTKDNIDTGKDYAEMHWCSAGGSQEKMKKRVIKYLVTRIRNYQTYLETDKDTENKKDRYEAIVTNRSDKPNDELIRWHYLRGGSIEQLHDRIKNDLAGNAMPNCPRFLNGWYKLQTARSVLQLFKN